MKILIIKENQLDYDGVILEKKTDDKDFNKPVKIDPFVGCLYSCPDELMSEYDNLRKSIVGTVISIKDDCYISKGVYLPQETDLL